MLAPAAAQADRRAMHNANRLKIGLCSARTARRDARSPSCRSAGPEAGRTTSGSRKWRTRPASISCCRSGAGRATAATPIIRAQRSRRVTWASGLLASTKRITVFGTVHAPLFNPVIAAKEMVTADHIGAGRFGLNIVVGWNEGEFDMFGVTQREHEAALRLRAGMDRRDQDDLVGQGGLRLSRQVSQHEGIRGKPKPYGGARPVIMNAGASPAGQAFAIRNCDAFFSQASRTSLDETARTCDRQGRRRRSRAGSSTSTPSASSPAGRPGRRPRTIIITPSSSMPTGRRWTASSRSRTSPRRTRRRRNSRRSATAYAHGMGGLPIVGDPDHVAKAARRSQPGRADRHRRFRSSTTSTSCRSSATRCCRGSSAWACARNGRC